MSVELVVLHSYIVAEAFHTHVDAVEAMKQVVAGVTAPSLDDSRVKLHGVADRKDDVTRVPYISFCRCRVETKNGRIPAA